ncbi:hypothetical protein BGV58_28925 [Burkholderia ubonensis]|nr:hypothetical protein BGV58_28925 [Burkholderia ubonensis]
MHDVVSADAAQPARAHRIASTAWTWPSDTPHALPTITPVRSFETRCGGSRASSIACCMHANACSAAGVIQRRCLRSTRSATGA